MDILFQKTPLIIGHRGAAALLPENTLPSFHLALGPLQSDMIEFDVRITKDQVPVIFHDAKLERTTNGKGFLCNHSFEDIQKLDAGFYFDPQQNKTFPERGKGIKIPAFEDLLANFPQNFLAVEIKESPPTFTRSVMALIQKHNAMARVIVGSKFNSVALELKKNYPSIPRFCSQKEIAAICFEYKSGNRNPAKNSSAVASIPLQSSGCKLDTQGMIDYFHKKQMRVFYWTVNAPEIMMDLLKKGADGIITDNPETANRVLGRTGTDPTAA